MKTPTALISVLLCAALLFISPTPTVQAQPHRDVIEYLIVGALVIGVGAVVIIGLKTMASKIPAPTPPPAPPTNPPPVMNPTNAPPTNNPPKPWYKRIFSFSSSAIPQYNISTFQLTDQQSTEKALVYYDTLISFSVQSTTNLIDWKYECTVTNWISASGMFSAYYRDGVNITNTYTHGSGWTNYVPIDIGSGDEAVKFFRITP
jgi:hypothetical protein